MMTHIADIYSILFQTIRGTYGLIVENRYVNSSSNPGPDSLSFTLR